MHTRCSTSYSPRYGSSTASTMSMPNMPSPYCTPVCECHRCVPAGSALKRYSNVWPGGMGSCDTLATPSICHVPSWVMPCQWMVVPSGRALLTRTTMGSPSRARIVGPGSESFTRIMPPFFAMPSGQGVRVTGRTVKLCTTSRGTLSAAAPHRADGTRATAAAAVSVQKPLRVSRLFMVEFPLSGLRWAPFLTDTSLAAAISISADDSGAAAVASGPPVRQGAHHGAAQGKEDGDGRQRIDDGGGHHGVPRRVGVVE